MECHEQFNPDKYDIYNQQTYLSVQNLKNQVKKRRSPNEPHQQMFKVRNQAFKPLKDLIDKQK